MRLRFGLTVAAIVSVGGCAPTPEPRGLGAISPLLAAERLIDAFYAFEPAPLRAALADARSSEAQILYYQGWAKGGNYVVLERRPCRFEEAGEVRCEITVRDDLIAALGTGYHVTDTFEISLQDGRIVKVDTSSNDPPEFDEALTWLRRERPQVFTGPCRGFFAGGPTPEDCVRSVVRGFADFVARSPR